MGKMFRKISAAIVSMFVLSLLLGACTTTTTATNEPTQGGGAAAGGVAGAHAFMFKSTGNTFGDLMYEGFAEYLQARGERTINRSPAETTVAAQVQLLNELITQQVASITISTNGDAGYDQVFQRAAEAGIPIISLDSEANPDFRVTHIDQAQTSDIGAYLVQAAVLIALGIDYPTTGTMRDAVERYLADYTGPEIVIGVLSASIDTPVQNSWIAAMRDELADPIYAGKVSPDLDIKFGNDDLTESTTQAQAFVAEDRVNVIVAPTTVGIAAAGQVLRTANSDIMLTGLGLPSEMQSFMPTTIEADPFDYPVPFMMLWDVIHLGAVAGAATYAVTQDGFDGEVGSTFEMNSFREYPATTFTAFERGDGTGVLAGTPYVFHGGNMSEWIPRL